MKIALLFGIVILLAAGLFAGARLTQRLKRPWLRIALVVALIAYAILLWRQVAPWPISDSAVIVVALLAAAAIGLTLTSASALIAFCITAGIVDFFSFSSGLTAKIITDYAQSHNLLLQYLSITFPFSDQIVPIIGIGDLIILGSIYCALAQIGHTGWLAFLFPLGGLLIALAVGLLTGGIYALPFMGGTTVIYLLWKARAHRPNP